MFFNKPSHIARNIVVTLDFDGCVNNFIEVKIKYAKLWHGIDVRPEQVNKEFYPLGPKKYRELSDKLGEQHSFEFPLDPYVKEVLHDLTRHGFCFAIVTSRDKIEIGPCIKYCKMHGLPIKYFHYTSQTPKDLICGRLHSRAMMDDGLSKLMQFENTPVELFYMQRSWNAHQYVPLTHKGKIHEITDWRQFREYLIYMKRMHEAICYHQGWENNWVNLSKIVSFWRHHLDRAGQDFKDYMKENMREVA